MSKSVHAKPIDLGLVAQLVQMCVVRAVLGRLTGTVIDKNEIAHYQILFLASASVEILQHLRERICFLASCPLIVAFLQDRVGTIRQGNGAIACCGLGGDQHANGLAYVCTQAFC